MTSEHPVTVEDLAQLIAELQDQINDIQDDLGHTAPAPPPKPPTPPPRRWADRATPDQWNQLIDWVDNLTADYSIRGSDHIPPCWPAHPGVVEELAGLWRAWITAVVTDEAAEDGAVDVTAWHDRWLWPCLRRLRDTMYSTTECRTAHQHVPSVVVPELTDRALIPLPTTDSGAAADPA